jgi:hypothetical protein
VKAFAEDHYERLPNFAKIAGLPGEAREEAIDRLSRQAMRGRENPGKQKRRDANKRARRSRKANA